MSVPNSQRALQTSSYQLPRKMFDEFKNRCPKRGDRNKVLHILIEKFLKKEITVKSPERVF